MPGPDGRHRDVGAAVDAAHGWTAGHGPRAVALLCALLQGAPELLHAGLQGGLVLGLLQATSLLHPPRPSVHRLLPLLRLKCRPQAVADDGRRKLDTLLTTSQ